jgi:hypothetical protein
MKDGSLESQGQASKMREAYQRHNDMVTVENRPPAGQFHPQLSLHSPQTR